MDVSSCRAALRGHEAEEQILKDNPGRWVVLPIAYPQVWDMFKKHEACFWTAEEIDFAQDAGGLATLPDKAITSVKKLTLLNSASNGSVYGNLSVLSCRLLCDVTIPEARAFYGMQVAMENIHREAQTYLAETLMPDPTQREADIKELLCMPAVQGLGAYVKEHCSTDTPFAEKAAGCALMKRLFSAGTDVVAYVLKGRKLLPGLVQVQSLIGRDERAHSDFAALLYRMLTHKLPNDLVVCMAKDAVEKSVAAMDALVDYQSMGINRDELVGYHKWCADSVLESLSHGKAFMTPNPYTAMTQEMTSKCEGQEVQPSTGSRHIRVCLSGSDTHPKDYFSLNEDF
ncbi:unnamed protein product [Vitrella brassicaformis CCMP3155]|uniref:Uncharacterized protein n=2 Tax=Vitrella brassicaformis TaxID=1169539 RepID=A0A0G4ESU8_VITBC|nr:unnamed protein product [Vitrella brassicaformis CCMP3155]|eukprot:CEM01728.1 unnamed protein product [Vitrella brassicaformis CCMP3155]